MTRVNRYPGLRRLPFDAIRSRVGFVAEQDRQRCATCARRGAGAADHAVCAHTGLYITAFSVCNEWLAPCGASNPVPNRSKTEILPHGADTASGAPGGPRSEGGL